MLSSVGELWDEEQYHAEFDVASFQQRYQKADE